ncbi:MAG: RBBP9/YdeN family alpha/beta hydrolase [Chakrabartia sp.]
MSLSPLILTVPGLENSGPHHWQTLWEARLPHCSRVELGMWEQPHRNTWVNNLNLTILSASAPVVLAAHSLGCMAVAWWAALAPDAAARIKGALLVAPPEVENAPCDERLRAFAPVPRKTLPFPTIVVGSHDDPYLSLEGARTLARDWGARFADAGRVGHINARSGLGDWPFGQFLLRQLIAMTACQPSASCPMLIASPDCQLPTTINENGDRPSLLPDASADISADSRLRQNTT